MIEVSVTNWNKYNPRTDRAHHQWFRVQNDFFADPKIFSLSGDDQRLFIYICGERSKRAEERIEINESLVAAMLHITPQGVLDGVMRLGAAGLIITHSTGNQYDVSCLTTNDTYVRNVRNVRNEGEATQRVANGPGGSGDGPPPLQPFGTLYQDGDQEEDKDWLSGIPRAARKAWDEAYGKALVLEQLPLAKAGWLSDEMRQRVGGKALYVRRWLQNASEAASKAKRASEAILAPVAPKYGGALGLEEGLIERLNREEAELCENPPDKAKVRAMLMSVIEEVS